MATNQESYRHVALLRNLDIRDVRALSKIMMKLMQKHVKENEAIRIENLNR